MPCGGSTAPAHAPATCTCNCTCTCSCTYFCRWVSTLKTPEQLQNSQGITVYRQKGFSLEKEDITLQSKEMGQRIKESMTGGSQTGSEVGQPVCPNWQ